MYPVSGPREVAGVLKASRLFFEEHGLPDSANALPEQVNPSPDEEAALRRALKAGLDLGFVLPPPSAQLEQAPKLLEATAVAELAGLPEGEQYQPPFSPVDDLLTSSEVRNRTEAAYLLRIGGNGYPDETRGRTGPQIDKLFREKDWTSLTFPEYLVLQRRSAEEHQDHRFDYYGRTVEDTQWMWLVDSRQGEGTFMGYWNPGKSRVELGWCKIGSKNPRKDAHPTVVVPLG
ncbi:MAG TPA: hypothetical protein VGA52_04560 [Anaerolineales bacterium]